MKIITRTARPMSRTIDGGWSISVNSSGCTHSEWNSIGIGGIMSKAKVYGHRYSAWNEYNYYITKLM
jgi:hypothetical protein